MGQIEKDVTKRRKRAQLQRIILQSVSVAGFLAVGLVAPNVLGAMAKLGLLPRSRQNELIKVARDRLIRKNLLRYEKGLLCLTKEGGRKLLLLELDNYRTLKPKRWDGKWRVLIFDISEKRRKLRDKIRRTLVIIGFMRLQDSVWFYPYDCEDLITLLKADFRVGKDVLYMVVEALENDKPLRQYFSLS